MGANSRSYASVKDSLLADLIFIPSSEEASEVVLTGGLQEVKLMAPMMMNTQNNFIDKSLMIKMFFHAKQPFHSESRLWSFPYFGISCSLFLISRNLLNGTIFYSHCMLALKKLHQEKVIAFL